MIELKFSRLHLILCRRWWISKCSKYCECFSRNQFKNSELCFTKWLNNDFSKYYHRLKNITSTSNLSNTHFETDFDNSQFYQFFIVYSQSLRRLKNWIVSKIFSKIVVWFYWTIKNKCMQTNMLFENEKHMNLSTKFLTKFSNVY